MNINLVYEGKDYNFDIPNGVTIDYLKELSSKIFNSEKELLDLIYNNEKVSNNDDKTLIRDLIPEGETNAVLTVQINKNLKKSTKNNSKKIIPLVNLKQKNIESINEDDENIVNEKIKNKNKKNEKNIIKEKKEIKSFDNQIRKEGNNHFKNNVNTKNFTNNIKIKKKIVFNGVGDKISNNNFHTNFLEKELNQKILFETAFLKKNNEFFTLIKEFNEKIKKLYLMLYKKFKNSGLASNNISSFSSNNTSRSTINLSINNNYFYELSLFEKRIINFQEKQIQLYKSLLEILKKYDINVNFNKLTEFYNKLIIININDNKNINLEKLKSIKLTSFPSKKIINTNSSKNLSFSNTINNANKLPLINNSIAGSPIYKDNSRNILINNANIIKSSNTTNNMTYNSNKENNDNIIKLTNNNSNCELNKSKIKNNIPNEDNNLPSKHNKINNNICKNNSNKNLINNKDIASEKKSDENNIDNFNNYIKKVTTNIINKNIYNSINKNINNISPIKILRRGSVSNFRVRKLSDKYNEKENANNIIYEESNAKRSSLKNGRYSPDKRIDIEDSKKNDNLGGKKIKIKDINVSTMTVNDSNFAREKHFDQKKNKKNSINKYDFLV